ncbi:MAG TPA: trypsin-like peptidase domain-containing protein [Ktedonobacteraceae bacterium]|nr:trypsin-like peptidase domain-containing protein [Ktedonobacteraceae bacterium]
MTQSLYELLADCTVRILASGGSGTGFFVAPGLILTCAHVIENAQQGGMQKLPIKVFWKGQEYSAQIGTFRNAPYPDLALLQAPISDHPYVLLHGGAEPFSELYSYGYADTESQGASTTFACEGWAGDQHELLKFKEGQVRPGMSGSPVLNRQTGSVCGIVQTTRDRTNALGGKAMLTKVVLREFPELEEKQRQFHQQDRRWANALTPQQRQQLHLSWLPAPSLPQQHGTMEVFYSYAHKDEGLRDELDTHLALLKRQKLITGWFDREISEGKELEGEIAEHLNSAPIILLLVSTAFMASDYCYDKEMQRAMERHEAKEARVIPIILRPCDWHSAPFGKLKALPKDGKPVISWSNRDEAFLDIAQALRRVVADVAKAQGL